MSHRPGFRPQAKVRPYVWVDSGTQERTPGIGLLHRGTVLAHLTANEARSMADRLHDLAEKIDNPEVLQNASPVTDVAPKLVLRRITAADGTEEPDLITTPAESE